MNFSFLFVIAVPLALYLLVLLFKTSDLGGDASEPEHAQIAEYASAPAAVLVAPSETVVAAEAVHAETPHVAEAIASAAVVEPVSKDAAKDSAEPVVVPIVVAAAVATYELVATDAVVDSAESVAPISAAGSAALVVPVEPVAKDDAATAAGPAIAAASVIDATTESRSPGDAASENTTPDAAQTPSAVAASATAAAEATTQNPKAEGGTVSAEPGEVDLGGEESILPEGPAELPQKGSPKYVFDYRGRLWVEKKQKGFFRQLRRPQIPPEEPGG